MNGKDWKWWHFVVAGILIGAYGGYQIYDGQISRAVGSFVLATLCVVFGLFSRKREEAPKQQQPTVRE
jgi:hypothetical protein